MPAEPPPRPSVSVVIPVKDGAADLPRLFAGLARQPGPLEVLVVDSGSRDASVAIARAAGARVVEIPPEQFGHGRTRNAAAALTSGEIVCFLTQDASPVDGWLDALLDAFAIDARIGAVYGPHLPHPATSPMVARELRDVFAQYAPGHDAVVPEHGDAAVDPGHGDIASVRAAVVQGPGDPAFLSNVNAAYRRACWEAVRFRDVAYAEDQAFGVDLLDAGWLKAYAPRAGVLHAHDYGPLDFVRRWFDEYRGLRAATGWIEPFRPRAALGATIRLTRADLAWMRERGWGRSRRLAWGVRAVVHHASRRVAAPLGSRADRLPRRVRRALSLERRDDGR